jgi:hypothetical protein
MAAIPITLEARPIDEDGLEFIGDLDEMNEVTMCSCSAGDDQPY